MLVPVPKVTAVEPGLWKVVLAKVTGLPFR